MTSGLDPLDALAAAGFPLDDLSEQQRDVLRGLSAAELAVLLEVQQRLTADEPDVVAHQQAIIGGLLF